MDDFAEIGKANHADYEKQQEKDRRRRGAVPEGECPAFDEAYERGIRLQELDLSKVDVNMFSAVDNHLINDGCGLEAGKSCRSNTCHGSRMILWTDFLQTLYKLQVTDFTLLY